MVRHSCWKATWVGRTWRQVVLVVRVRHSFAMGAMPWVDRSSTRDDVIAASAVVVGHMCVLVVHHS